MFDLFQNVFLKFQLKLFIPDFFFKTLIYNNIVNIDCLKDLKLKYRVSIGSLITWNIYNFVLYNTVYSFCIGICFRMNFFIYVILFKDFLTMLSNLTKVS